MTTFNASHFCNRLVDEEVGCGRLKGEVDSFVLVVVNQREKAKQ